MWPPWDVAGPKFKGVTIFIHTNTFYTERCGKMNEKENLLQRHYCRETAIIKPS
jgi:hypothetical protein